jgi:hypothetical protein
MSDEELDNWVYDLEGKPWGVSEIGEKLLSIRDEDDPRTRSYRFIRGHIAQEKPAGENVAIELHHQKRLDGTIPDGRLLLPSLRDGEWIWLDLDRSETTRLFHHLENLYALGGGGIDLVRGYQQLQVSGEGEAVVAQKYIELVEAIAQEQGTVVLEILGRLHPELVIAEALTKQYQERSRALLTFDEHMAAGDPWSEEDWQKFFKANDWIFGHGLAYQFLVNEQAKPYLGGTDPTGSGAQYGDFFMSSTGVASFSVIVEIKKPDTHLTEGTKSTRNGAWLLGKELVIGVAQVQANCELWAVETSKTKGSERWLRERGIRVIEPKGILVAGNFTNLKDHDTKATDERIETFERFRRGLTNPEVLTYDELLARARAMLSVTKPEGAKDLVLTVTDDPDDGPPEGFNYEGPEPDVDPDWEPDPDDYEPPSFTPFSR